MAKRLNKEKPNVLVEAEKIIRREQSNKLFRDLPPQFPDSTRELESRKLSTSYYWCQMLKDSRKFPATELHDDALDVRQEIHTLRNRVHSLEEQLSHYINELRTKVERDVRKLTSIDELRESYIETVKNIDIVSQIFLVESKDVVTIWTIIDAPPFDDSLRMPIYDAQVKILSTQKGNVPLDFYILNVSELSEAAKTESIIPSNGKLIWKR